MRIPLAVAGDGFQLPPSHEGELAPGSHLARPEIFQLPPSHEGEQLLPFCVAGSLIISTPALA